MKENKPGIDSSAEAKGHEGRILNSRYDTDGHSGSSWRISHVSDKQMSYNSDSAN